MPGQLQKKKHTNDAQDTETAKLGSLKDTPQTGGAKEALDAAIAEHEKKTLLQRAKDRARRSCCCC